MSDQGSLFHIPAADGRPTWLREIDDQGRYVGRRHPDTAQAMQRRILPTSGTLRRQVYDLILAQDGLTDDELEYALGRSHQSISGCRATLKKDGWLEDSGVRRRNRYGNTAIVWRAVPDDRPRSTE